MVNWTAVTFSLSTWFTPHVKSCEWRGRMKRGLRGQHASFLWDSHVVVPIVWGDLQTSLFLIAPQNHKTQWALNLWGSMAWTTEADRPPAQICRDRHYQQSHNSWWISVMKMTKLRTLYSSQIFHIFFFLKRGTLIRPQIQVS